MSTISGMGQGNNQLMAQLMQRPNPAKMADSLFSKLDTSGKGYLEKSDLQSAFNQLSSSGKLAGSKSVASSDEIFQKLDGNSDGKVTKDEMTIAIEKLAATLDSQINQMRMDGTLLGRQGGMAPHGGMPPPPSSQGGGDKPDLTKEQLTSMSSALASTDSQRASQMSNIAQNFEAADTNSDGKVSFQEAQAYDQAHPSSTASSSGEVSNNSSSNMDARILKQMMDLFQAYGYSDSSSSGSIITAVA